MNLITITDAARWRGVNRSTIWRWIKKYGLKSQHVGFVWLVDADELLNFTPPKRGPKEKK